MKIPFLTVIFSMAIAASSQAALLTSFSDNFNRPDGGLGSNYTVNSGAAFAINNNTAYLASPDENRTSVNVGTLPTATDFGNGYSFTASLDVFWINANNTGLEGLLLNYTDENNYLTISLRGDDNLNIQARGYKAGVFYIGVPIAAITFTDNTWYTLSVYSGTAGVYDVSLSLQGSGVPLRTGTFNAATDDLVDPPINATLTGGTIGLLGTGGGPNSYDNLSVTVVPEPSVAILLGAGLMGLVGVRRLIRRRS